MLISNNVPTFHAMLKYLYTHKCTHGLMTDKIKLYGSLLSSLAVLVFFSLFFGNLVTNVF